MGSRPRPVDLSFPCRFLVAALVLVAVAARPVGAEAVREADYAAVNRDLVVGHALPRFAALRKAAAEMKAAAEALCRAPSQAALAQVRTRFHATMDAWMGVQHLRFGPAELFSRADRLYFWPQARGKIAAAVDKLLAGGAVPAPDHMTTASAAIQGLPALEHLLFDRGATLLRGAGKRPCAVLRAVTDNVGAIAHGLAADWTGGRVAFGRVVARPGPGNLFYKRHQEATLAFFQSLHDGLQAIVDVRLKPVLGAKPGAGRPRLAESRSSGRSMRNVAASLAALAALYHGEGKARKGFAHLVAQRGDAKLDALMQRAFRLTLANARSITKPLDAAVADKALRLRVAKLLLQARALKQIVRTRLAPAIGLTVGFNALDGD